MINTANNFTDKFDCKASLSMMKPGWKNSSPVSIYLDKPVVVVLIKK